MQDAERFLIEHACQRLMVGYCLYADHWETDKFVDLFAEDGAWVQGSGERIQGHDALRRYLTGRSPRTLTRHVITDILVDVVDADNATGLAYAMAFRDREFDGKFPAPMRTPNGLIEYQDKFRRTAKGWKFAERRSVPIFG